MATAVQTQKIPLGKTFFPGSRKQVRIQSVQLLEDDGIKSIKLDCLMPFSDGKLTGMPDWVGTAFDHLGKEGTLEKATKFEHSIEEMSLYIFETPEQKDPSRTSMLCQLTNFTMIRQKEAADEEELGDVQLKFVLYSPGNKSLWSWLYEYIHMKLWIRFDCTQEDLAEDKAKQPEAKQLPLVGDKYEKDRREATSKDRDAEFDAPKKTKRGAAVQ